MAKEISNLAVVLSVSSSKFAGGLSPALSGLDKLSVHWM